MKSKKVEKQGRKQYSPEFKKEALLRAERDGAAAAARDLGLNVNQLYSWRTKERASGQVSDCGILSRCCINLDAQQRLGRRKLFPIHQYRGEPFADDEPQWALSLRGCIAVCLCAYQQCLRLREVATTVLHEPEIARGHERIGMIHPERHLSAIQCCFSTPWAASSLSSSR